MTASDRHQLSPADRELFDLRYLDPNDEDAFARNLLTSHFNPDDGGRARPLVTIYAAPDEPAYVLLPRLLARLKDQGLQSWAPASRNGPLVPGLYRTTSGGVIAHDGNRDLSGVTHAFALRATGSVELLDGALTAVLNDGRRCSYARRSFGLRRCSVTSSLSASRSSDLVLAYRP
jgi:hypothetical protein